MARYPGAEWRPVERYKAGGPNAVPMSRYDVGEDHTYVGSPTPDRAFDGFNTPGNPVPHLMFFPGRKPVQYIDTDFRSSATLEGNPRCVTWETWDGFPDMWTDGQAPLDSDFIVEEKAKFMVWLHDTHGIPLVRLPDSRPASRGMGWHRLGIDGNFPTSPGTLLGGRVADGENWSTSFGKTCPTDTRIRQFVNITLPRAIEISQGARMPTVRNIEEVTAETNSDGDVVDLDVTKGEHWPVLGVVPSPDDAFNVVIRASAGTMGLQYRKNFRCFKRLADGTLVPNANATVRFVFLALG